MNTSKLSTTIGLFLVLAIASVVAGGGDKSGRTTIITLAGGGSKQSHPTFIPIPFCSGGHGFGGFDGMGSYGGHEQEHEHHGGHSRMDWGR